jgi:hypothetical protein
MKKAYELMGKLDTPPALLDIAAALAWLRSAGQLKVGVVGFCRGGLLSWLSATRLDPQAAVGYYPGGIGDVAEETPKAPVMLHFGEADSHIPLNNADKVRAPKLPCWPRIVRWRFSKSISFNGTLNGRAVGDTRANESSAGGAASTEGLVSAQRSQPHRSPYLCQ